MYEETQSKIDWKGIFLKVIIAFLVVLIAIKGYSTLKGNSDVMKRKQLLKQQQLQSQKVLQLLLLI